MSEIIKLKRGLNLKLKGAAEKILSPGTPAVRYGVKPIDFPGLVPKLSVKPGDEVKEFAEAEEEQPKESPGKQTKESFAQEVPDEKESEPEMEKTFEERQAPRDDTSENEATKNVEKKPAKPETVESTPVIDFNKQILVANGTFSIRLEVVGHKSVPFTLTILVRLASS